MGAQYYSFTAAWPTLLSTSHNGNSSVCAGREHLAPTLQQGWEQLYPMPYPDWGDSSLWKADELFPMASLLLVPRWSEAMGKHTDIFSSGTNSQEQLLPGWMKVIFLMEWPFLLCALC